MTIVNDRAQALITQAHTQAHHYIASITQAPNSPSADAARLGHEIAQLQTIVRNLVAEVYAQKMLVQMRDELLVDAGVYHAYEIRPRTTP